MLTILLDDKILFKLDILSFFSVILAIVYSVGLFLWLLRLDECLFLKAIVRGFAVVDRYIGFALDKADDAPQDDSYTSAQDNQVIGSEDNSNKDKDHENPSVTTEHHCSVCWKSHQIAQRTSSIDIDSNSLMSINTDAVPENYILSRAESALLFLANHLESYVDDITQAEARDMLSKLRTLRSTVGSRVPLFTHRNNLLMHCFDPDGWYGEACLIDVSIWLLKKRFPGPDESQSELAGFVLIKENKGKGSTEQKCDKQEQGEETLQQDKQEQEDEEEHSSMSSRGQLESHDDPVASVEPDMPSSSSSTSSLFNSVLTAQGLTFHVNYSVVDRLEDLSVPEVDELVVELREHRRELIDKRTNAIVRSFWGGKEYLLEVKALSDARIGLVDGIMAVIRQYNLSSHSPVREPSDDSIPSLFRLGNPRERRNSF